MPFRIFEFAVGAAVLLLEARFRLSEAVAEALSVAGLLCIVASVLLFTSDLPHLEAAILLPCLGAAATIWAGAKTRASELLTNRPMIAIGSISYSLYLCHWPIIFFGRFIFGGAANAPAGVVTMAILMVAVATAMNLLIERRFIQPSGFKSPGFLKYAAGFCSVILGLAAITHMTFLSKGFTWRLLSWNLRTCRTSRRLSGTCRSLMRRSASSWSETLSPVNTLPISGRSRSD